MLSSLVLLLPIGIYRRCWGKFLIAKMHILSSIAILPNGEYYISCVVLKLQMAYIADTEHYCSITKRRLLYKLRRIAVAICWGKISIFHKAYLADTEHYCSITKRRILHKLRRIAVANGVYCRCWAVLQLSKSVNCIFRCQQAYKCSRCWVVLQMLITIAVAVAMWRYSTVWNKAS